MIACLLFKKFLLQRSIFTVVQNPKQWPTIATSWPRSTKWSSVSNSQINLFLMKLCRIFWVRSAEFVAVSIIFNCIMLWNTGMTIVMLMKSNSVRSSYMHRVSSLVLISTCLDRTSRYKQMAQWFPLANISLSGLTVSSRHCSDQLTLSQLLPSAPRYRSQRSTQHCWRQCH